MRVTFPASMSFFQPAYAAWAIASRDPADTAGGGVPVDGRGVPGPQLQRGGGLGRGRGTGTSVGELRRPRCGGDQAQRAAALDRGELPVVAQEPHDRAARGGEPDELVEHEGARHPGLVDEHDVAGAEAEHAQVFRHRGPGAEPGGGRPGGPFVHELVQVLRPGPELAAEDVG